MNTERLKQQYRVRLRTQRTALSKAVAQALSQSICNHAIRLPLYLQSQRVGLYWPVRNEVDPSPILHHAWQLNKIVYLPIVDRIDASLRFGKYASGERLATSHYGIPEPVNHEDAITPHQIHQLDLLFLPLLGFDNQGGRLGYGGGYYDRFLADGNQTGLSQHKRPGRIGLAYGFQELSRLPVTNHDAPLDGIITETGFRPFGEYALSEK